MSILRKATFSNSTAIQNAVREYRAANPSASFIESVETAKDRSGEHEVYTVRGLDRDLLVMCGELAKCGHGLDVKLAVKA